MNDTEQSPLNAWRWPALIAAVVGVIGCAVGALDDIAVLWRAYLVGFMCIWLITVGAIGLLALGNLTGGRWAALGRPFYLAIAKLLPLVAILFIPIAMNLSAIYPWANESTRADLHLAEGKAWYLEQGTFLARAAIYFVVWLVMGFWVARVSRLNRQPGDLPGMSRVGALAIVLLVPTVTFAAFDWGMSLEPNWYSSIYGALLTAGGVLAAHALAIVSIARLPVGDVSRIMTVAGFDTKAHHGHQEQPFDPGLEHGHDAPLTIVVGDMGNLMLAFVMVWTYFAFSQFLIIWSGNLPSEITWYLPRIAGGWLILALGIVLFHFAVPFGMLLSRRRKRDAQRLKIVATMLLVMYCLNLYWVIAPAYAGMGARGLLACGAAILALGGIWMAFYSWLAPRSLRGVSQLA